MTTTMKILALTALVTAMSCGRKAEDSRSSPQTIEQPDQSQGSDNQNAGPNASTEDAPSTPEQMADAKARYASCLGLEADEVDSEAELSLGDAQEICSAFEKSMFLSGVQEESEPVEI